MEIEHTDGSCFDFYDIIILVGIIYDSSNHLVMGTFKPWPQSSC